MIWCPICQVHAAAVGGKPCPVCVGRGKAVVRIEQPTTLQDSLARVPVPPPSRRWWKR